MIKSAYCIRTKNALMLEWCYGTHHLMKWLVGYGVVAHSCWCWTNKVVGLQSIIYQASHACINEKRTCLTVTVLSVFGGSSLIKGIVPNILQLGLQAIMQAWETNTVPISSLTQLWGYRKVLALLSLLVFLYFLLKIRLLWVLYEGMVLNYLLLLPYNKSALFCAVDSESSLKCENMYTIGEREREHIPFPWSLFL